MIDLRHRMRDARAMIRRSPTEIPVDLRARLEAARLDLLALFRALDRMDLSPAEIPQRIIRQLFELDADYVEALWALDQPPGSLDLRVMLRDTLASLEQLPETCSRFRKNLPPRAHPALAPSKSLSASAWTRWKHTTWSPSVIPKAVKHPWHTRPPPSQFQ
jgi:hypothetical protein